MPGKVFSTKRAVAIKAPVLPALTQALASPDLTKLMATRIEESFLFFKALWGDSSINTTCEVGCIRKRGLTADLYAFSAACIASSKPTNTILS